MYRPISLQYFRSLAQHQIGLTIGYSVNSVSQGVLQLHLSTPSTSLPHFTSLRPTQSSSPCCIFGHVGGSQSLWSCSSETSPRRLLLFRQESTKIHRQFHFVLLPRIRCLEFRQSSRYINPPRQLFSSSFFFHHTFSTLDFSQTLHST